MQKTLRIAALAALLAGLVTGCDTTTGPKMRPQSVVLLVTPKILHDFDNPENAIAAFFNHYKPLTARAAETIVIFAVGNSDHILGYRGRDYWDDRIEWARTTNFVPISEATLDYKQLARIVVGVHPHVRVDGGLGPALGLLAHLVWAS